MFSLQSTRTLVSIFSGIGFFAEAKYEMGAHIDALGYSMGDARLVFGNKAFY